MTITVELSGGMANQLFQWAAGEILSIEFGKRLILDTRVVDRPWERGLQIAELLPPVPRVSTRAATKTAWKTVALFGKGGKAAAKRIADRYPRPGVLVGDYGAARRALSGGRSVRLRGLFQDTSELLRYRAHIVSALEPGMTSVKRRTELPNSPYAAMHVRRGDYLAVPEYEKRFGVCSPQYFRSAIDALDPALPVFASSDDRAWVDREFGDKSGRVSIFKGEDQFEDFMLLTNAAQLVMSNSTFSWWAGFLGAQKLVVCPQPWFNNAMDDQKIELDEWIRLPK